jgi:hypothetical protein
VFHLFLPASNGKALTIRFERRWHQFFHIHSYILTAVETNSIFKISCINRNKGSLSATGLLLVLDGFYK